MRRIGGSKILKNILVDGNNLAYRSYFSADKLNKLESLGTTVNFISFLNEYVRILGSFDSISIFWDGTSNFRKKILPSYKENRKKLPLLKEKCSVIFGEHILSDERSLLMYALKRLGVDQYYNDQYEADDLIASYVKHHSEEVNIIISDDKDFFPLFYNPRLVIYRPSVREYLDSESANVKLSKAHDINYHGYKMFKIIYGDKSDNIHGIPLYPKRLAGSVCGFKSVSELLESDLPSQVKAPLLLHRDLLIQNENLISFKDNLDIRESLITSMFNLDSFNHIWDRLGVHKPRIGNFIKQTPPASLLPNWYSDL